MYNIPEPCYHGSNAGVRKIDPLRLPSSFRRLGEIDKPFPVRKRIFGRAWPLRAPVRPEIVPTWPQLAISLSVPCIVS